MVPHLGRFSGREVYWLRDWQAHGGLHCHGMSEGAAPDRATVVGGPPDGVSRALEEVPRPYYCLDERGQAVHQTSATEMIERMLRLLEVGSGQRVLETAPGRDSAPRYSATWSAAAVPFSASTLILR